MPYYLHECILTPQSGTPYPDKPAALARRAEGQTVTFVASDDERQTWQEREQDRFESDAYHPVPWDCAYLCPPSYDCWRCQLSRRHFAHLSLKHPGLIAYTPNDEFGIADRQLRVKPGKYLLEFAPHLSQTEIDRFVGSVKAYDGKYKIATTADEIRSVYRNSATGSCMTKGLGAYRSGDIHPVEVYGDSDLAVAYLGTLDHVTARCVIWPEHKIRTRLYGDETLNALLKQDGYKGGSLSGARIRAISCRNGYVMPYIDEAESAELDGNYFILSDDCDGEYSTKNTDGLAGEPERHYCSRDHCSNTCDEDESYCSDCEDDRFYCQECDQDSWDEPVEIGGPSDRVCEDCARQARTSCTVCDEYHWPSLQWTEQERQARRARNVDDLCPDCAETHQYCTDCETHFDRDDVACPDCDAPAPAERCRKTPDLPLETPAPMEAPCVAF